MLSSTINMFDELISRTYVSLFEEKNSLITFLFHVIFNDNNEIKQNVVDPQQTITKNKFRQFIEYYLEHNYTFVSPEDILTGLENSKKYILVTFDDGYYNNHIALSILKEYRLSATFFISANHIAENKCFWWDVIYRERIKRNATTDQINNEFIALKQKKNDAIEEYIIDTFGEKALRPIGDIDRPFTPSELKSFSTEPFVSLGNHTSNHAILTNYPHSEIKSEIVNSQNYIFSITGITPIIISYPNGNYSEEILTISKEIGLKLGITVNEHKNYLPINLQGIDPLLLNRYMVWGNREVKKQCACFRSDIQLKDTIVSLIKRRSK